MFMRSVIISSTDSYSPPKIIDSSSMQITFMGQYQIDRFLLLSFLFTISPIFQKRFQMMSLIMRLGLPVCVRHTSRACKNSSLLISPNQSKLKQLSTNLMMTSLWATPCAVSQISLNCQYQIQAKLASPLPQAFSSMLSIFSSCWVFLLLKISQFSIMLMRNIFCELSLLWLQVMSQWSLQRCSLRNYYSVLSSSLLRMAYLWVGSRIDRSLSRIQAYCFFYFCLRRMQLVNRLCLRDDDLRERNCQQRSQGAAWRSFLGWSRSFDLDWIWAVACSTISLRCQLYQCGSRWQLTLRSSISLKTIFSTKSCLMLCFMSIFSDRSCSSIRQRQCRQFFSAACLGVSSSSCVEKQICEMCTTSCPPSVSSTQSMSLLQLFFQQMSIFRSSTSSLSIFWLVASEGMQQYLTKAWILLVSFMPQRSINLSRNYSFLEMFFSEESSYQSYQVAHIWLLYTISRMYRQAVSMKLAVNSPISCVFISFLYIRQKSTFMDRCSISFRSLSLSMMRISTKGEQKVSTSGLNAIFLFKLRLLLDFLLTTTCFTIDNAVSNRLVRLVYGPGAIVLLRPF